MTRALAVWWEGTVVGSLTVDRHGAMRFVYDGDWLADPSAPALSVSPPQAPAAVLSPKCRPFFEGLLPEGVRRDAVAEVFLSVDTLTTFVHPISPKRRTRTILSSNFAF